MKIVEIIWKDATGFDFIEPHEVEHLTLSIFKRVGYVIKEDKDIIAITADLVEKQKYFDEGEGIHQFKKVLLIPKSQIVKTNVLKDEK